MSRKNMKVDLFIVDPQNDFMGMDDGTSLVETVIAGDFVASDRKVRDFGPFLRAATLPVKGGVSDMRRLAKLVDRIGPKLNDIHVTLDSHQVVDVAHPGMWVDGNGKAPGPFTMISPDDIRNGIWRPRNPGHYQRLLAYTEALQASPNQYPLIIWPEHCIIGTWGHAVESTLMGALTRWARKEVANIDWIVKGTNPFTEHYGGFVAEVPDPNDQSTQLRMEVLQMLQNADEIYFAGEASSHCVRATVMQLVDNIGGEHVKKVKLITDCMSPVPAAPGTPDFPAIAQAFFSDMKARGMELVTADDVLA